MLNRLLLVAETYMSLPVLYVVFDPMVPCIHALHVFQEILQLKL